MNLPWTPPRSVFLAFLGAALVLVGSCTSSDGLSPDGSLPSPDSSGTTTTSPPVLLALTPDLDLTVDECWSELPPPAQTTSTTPPVTEIDPNPTAETVPAPLGDSATTIPQPTIVAQVDCDGSNEGQVFATFCLGLNQEASDPTQPALVAVACDPESEVPPWPGDREVRRAAARLCIQRFEQLFKEPYSGSELIAKEFVPTEGIWNRGLRGVVCWIDSTT